MEHLINNIALSAISKNFKDCNAGELKYLALRYPYSSSLQLLYAQKLKAENEPGYDAQWQRALLYFENPLLVNYFFTSHPSIIAVPAMEESAKKEAWPAAEQESHLPEKEEMDAATDEVILPGLKIEPIDPAKTQLTFTPYYTVDYFASQGIKANEEIKTNDQLGQQLKSFTAWLKQMRRLPEAETSAKYSFGEEQKVEKMAEKSILGDNALTSTMAEVWVKQNNLPKAIEIYQKLSLLNPAKSAYFAAKIEYLKKLL